MGKSSARGRGRGPGRPRTPKQTARVKAEKPERKQRAKAGNGASTVAATATDHYAQQDLNLPKQRDLAHHYSAYQIAKAKVDKANADLRNVCKQGEEAGVDMKAIKNASTLMKKDPLVSKSYFQQLGLILDNEGYGCQIVTYDARSGSDVDEARRAGHACAERGSFEENPYPDGTPPHEAFHDGYMSVQSDRLGSDEAQRDRREEGAGAAGA